MDLSFSTEIWTSKIQAIKNCSDFANGERLNFDNITVDKFLERIARIPMDNLRLFFQEFSKIMFEVNSKYEDYQQQISFTGNSLSLFLEKLRIMRENLQTLKNDILNLNSEYSSRCEAVFRTLTKDSVLYEKFVRLSQIQERLDRSREISVFMNSIKEVRRLMDSKEHETLFAELSKFLCNKFSSLEPYDDYNTEVDKILGEVRHYVSVSLQTFFDAINFPFERDIDLRSIASTIRQIIILIKSACIIESKSKNLIINREKVVNLLFTPLKKRFYFHFYSGRKTDDASKPEWFFTQILTWINANMEFIECISQEIYIEKADQKAVVNDFIDQLLSLITGKVRITLKKVTDERLLYSHLIDEAIAFETDLHDCGYVSPLMIGRVLSIFCEDSYINQWLLLEQDCCTSAVENLLTCQDKWRNRYMDSSDIDLYRVSECTDQFILLLEYLTARYRWIESVKLQTRFLELQILLLDDFRLRLVQILQELTSPWEEPFIQILNSLWYIAYTLDMWNDVDVFIRIQTKGKHIYGRGVFDEVAHMYKHLWQQRCNDMACAFYQQTKAQLGRYEKLNWFSVESTKASEISPSFFPFLLEVRKLLSKISSAISPDSAALLYRLINQKIAECFLEIISSTSFNCNGASQMLFDISSSLIPLLNSFYNDGLHNLKALDEPKFNGVITSLRLLSLPKAISLLLFDELKRIPNEMAPSVLAPHNICAMSRDNALNLLKQRCDLNLETDLKITW